jgi:hypothetical protein
MENLEEILSELNPQLPTSPDASFSLGDKVIFTGLVKVRQYNHLFGVVSGDLMGGRYPVEILLDPQHNNGKKLLGAKPENMHLDIRGLYSYVEEITGMVQYRERSKPLESENTDWQHDADYDSDDCDPTDEVWRFSSESDTVRIREIGQ